METVLGLEKNVTEKRVTHRQTDGETNYRGPFNRRTNRIQRVGQYIFYLEIDIYLSNTIEINIIT